MPGGGTVAYVNPTDHRYLDDPAHREEGGTPAIIESIRAGLVFQLKQAVGVDDPRPRGATSSGARCGVAAQPGDRDPRQPRRRAAVDRLVRRTRQRRAAATCTTTSSWPLLNDLFGIQSRGGCSCAGPYGHRLLGIDIERSHEFEREIAHGCEGIKPGWVRVNFNYFISEAVFDYVVEAVRLVADARLAAAAATTASTPRPGCGATAHGPVEPPLRLSQVGYDDDGALTLPAPARPGARVRPAGLPGAGGPDLRRGHPLRRRRATVSADFDHLRWLSAPGEPVRRLTAGHPRATGPPIGSRRA